MNSFLDFEFYRLPNQTYSMARLAGKGQAKLLSLYRTTPERQAEAQSYLITILEAVGYAPALTQTYLYPLLPQEQLQLVPMLQALQITKVLLFGSSLSELGIHIRCRPYEAVRWNGCLFLESDALLDIQREREAGGKAMAGALWKALKQHYS